MYLGRCHQGEDRDLVLHMHNTSEQTLQHLLKPNATISSSLQPPSFATIRKSIEATPTCNNQAAVHLSYSILTLQLIWHKMLSVIFIVSNEAL